MVSSSNTSQSPNDALPCMPSAPTLKTRPGRSRSTETASESERLSDIDYAAIWFSVAKRLISPMRCVCSLPFTDLPASVSCRRTIIRRLVVVNWASIDRSQMSASQRNSGTRPRTARAERSFSSQPQPSWPSISSPSASFTGNSSGSASQHRIDSDDENVGDESLRLWSDSIYLSNSDKALRRIPEKNLLYLSGRTVKCEIDSEPNAVSSFTHKLFEYHRRYIIA